MMRATICLAVLCVAVPLVALLMGGCSRAASRTLEIHQIQSTGTYNGQFQIDVSQLPEDAVKSRVDSGGEGSPLTRLTIDQKYPIRVVLVPAKQP